MEEEKKEKENARQSTVKSTVKDRKKHAYDLQHHSQVHHQTQERAHTQHRQEEQLVKATQVSDNDAVIVDCNDSRPLLDSVFKSQISDLGEDTELRLQDTDAGQYKETLSQKTVKSRLQTGNFYGSNLSSRDHLKTSQNILLPQGLKTAKSHKLTDRIKDSRLRGSDLYVARLSWKDTSCDQIPDNNVSSKQHVSEPAPPDDLPSTTSLTGSLYDELRLCGVKADVNDARPLRSSPRQRVATLSRPCYRCISYMHSAGVKRVFWTNAKGEWEGAKVQELVDAFEKPDGSQTKALFVTKHEYVFSPWIFSVLDPVLSLETCLEGFTFRTCFKARHTPLKQAMQY